MTRWMVKLGEGLLIGVGASIAFAAFQGMQNATEALNNANAKLLVQNNSNSKFSELIENNTHELRQLNSQLSKEISKNNKNIVKLVDQLQKSSENETTDNMNTFDLKPFTLPSITPHYNPLILQGDKIPLDPLIRNEFDALNKSIQYQESLGN